MSHKSLAIVIPAYNEAKHIKACLESISTQSIAPDAVILVDNNSTDETVAIASNYPFVTILKETRQGISFAHHTGFNYAKTDLIARIDADSVLPKNWIERVQEFYSHDLNDTTALVGSGYSKNLRAKWLHSKFLDGLFIGARILLGYYALWGPNMVLPKVCWVAIKDNTCAEKLTTYDDLDMAVHLHKQNFKIYWLRSLRIGVRVNHIDNPKKYYRYALRFPGTLKDHNDKKWIIAVPATLISTSFQLPLFYLLRKSKNK